MSELEDPIVKVSHWEDGKWRLRTSRIPAKGVRIGLGDDGVPVELSLGQALLESADD